MPILNQTSQENYSIYNDINKLYDKIVSLTESSKIDKNTKDDQLYKLQSIINEYVTGYLPKTTEQQTTEQHEKIHDIVKYCYKNQENRYYQDHAFNLLVKIAEKIPYREEHDPITFEDYDPNASVILSTRHKYNLDSLLRMFQSNITMHPMTQKPLTDHEFQRICQKIIKAIKDGHIQGKTKPLYFLEPNKDNMERLSKGVIWAMLVLFMVLLIQKVYGSINYIYKQTKSPTQIFSLNQFFLISAHLFLVGGFGYLIYASLPMSRDILRSTTEHTNHILPDWLYHFTIAEKQAQSNHKDNKNQFFKGKDNEQISQPGSDEEYSILDIFI